MKKKQAVTVLAGIALTTLVLHVQAAMPARGGGNWYRGNTIESQNGDRIAFMGANGTILQEVRSAAASYQMDESDLYVRARITNPDGKAAWTQPVLRDSRPTSPTNAVLNRMPTALSACITGTSAERGILVRLTISRPTAVRLDLLDCRGAVLRKRPERLTGIGTVDIAWAPAGANPLPVGAYWLRISAGGRTLVRAVSVLR